MEKLSYKPTVYEQIVIDYLEALAKVAKEGEADTQAYESAAKALDYDKYKKELAERGWSEKRYFDAYMKDIAYITSVVEKPDFNLRQAADIVKNNHASADEDVLYFALTEAEKQIVLDAEESGSMKDGEVITYEGYNKKIECHDYLNLPADADAFVIFSGHPGSAEPAIEAWFEDFKKTGNPKKLVFLGLYDNQGNTDFSNGNLEFNTGSEVEMYVRYCRKIGVSEEIIEECLVRPTDTSTDENTELLAEIRNKFFARDKEAKFVMFGYAAYQKRIASEFAYKFQKFADEGKVEPTGFIMPVVECEKNQKYRTLSYDNLTGIAQDIIIGNCLAHPYRVKAGGRFDSKLGKYPQKYKSLLPISLVYSYPNVANELAGTDTKVATVLKLLRAVQHKVYGWEDAEKVDNSIKFNLLRLRQRLSLRGLLSANMAFFGNKMSKKETEKCIKEHLQKTREEINIDRAKIVLGPNTRPEVLREAAKYYDNPKEMSKALKGNGCREG